MKIILTLFATLLTATALTSSKPRSAPLAANYNVLATNDQQQHPVDQRQHPIEKFIR